MTVKDGYITEATATELHRYWVTREWYYEYTWPDFLAAMRRRGVVITEEDDDWID